MGVAFKFFVVYVNCYNYIIFGHETESYLASLERLKQFCFWTVYNVDWWPTDSVSLRGELKPPDKTV